MRNGFMIQNDRLVDCSFVPSSNFDIRTNDEDISLLVIHCISLPPGRFGGDEVERLFTNKLDAAEHPDYESLVDLRVSAHCFIRRNGTVIQFVPFDKRAWHAGCSEYNGRDCCNDYSIGIELEGTEDVDYTSAQYETLAAVSAALLETYPKMLPSSIVGHSDISPNRKTDPGNSFCWQTYHNALNEVLNSQRDESL